MNKKFKRALSSILAFVMVISVLTVMNVSNVFAASYTYKPSSASSYDKDATIYTVTDVLTITAAGDLKGECIDADNDEYVLYTTNSGTNEGYTEGTDSNGKSLRVALAMTPEEDGELTVQCKVGSTGSSKTVDICTYDSENTVYKVVNTHTAEGDDYYDLTVDAAAGTTYYFEGSGTNSYIYSVSFTSATTSISLDVDDSIELAPGATQDVNATIKYDDTGLLSADDIVWTSNNTNVTVSPAAGASTTITVSSEATDGEEATITATLDELEASITVTVNSGAAKSVSSAIGAAGLVTNLSADYSSSIPVDTVFSNYFTTGGAAITIKTSGGNTFLELAKNSGSTVKFTTTKAFDVVVKFASTGSDKDSSINIKNSSGTAVADAQTVNGTTPITYTFASLPAGEYYIYNPGTDRATRLLEVSFYDPAAVDYDAKTITVGDTIYYISGLDSTYSESDVLAADSCKLTGVDSESGSISYVYTGVEVNEKEYAASDFGYSYVYGFEVLNATGTSTLASTYTLSLE
ncbi:MAG: hypothetical protein LUH47_08000 [Clostridiales bacterium]|nr:hypothetical protein [Clostridiales bacterium]